MVVVPWTPDLERAWRTVPLPEAASSETRMHLAVLAARHDVAAVVHAHPRAVLAAAARGLPPFAGEAVPPMVPPIQPGSVELAEAVGAALGSGANAVVLEAHGAVTAARTLDEAVRRMTGLERAAREALYRAGEPAEWNGLLERSLE